MQNKHKYSRSFMLRAATALVFGLASTAAFACKDTVVLVHGNTGSPSDWNNTVSYLQSKGWKSSEMVLPNWGSKSCATCNDHTGSNLDVVRNAIASAINNSCTGKVDVIGHSMGVTLSQRAIYHLGAASRVESFVGIAGAQRGLNSCGTYPWNVANATCGKWGLSKKSHLIEELRNRNFGSRKYSIKSWYDQIVCYGSCYVEGTHTSNVWRQNGSYTYNHLGHMGLQSQTAWTQWNLIK